MVDRVSEESLYWKIYLREARLPGFVRDYLDGLADLSLTTRYEYMKEIELFLDYLIDHQIVNKKVPVHIESKDLSALSEADIKDYLQWTSRYEREFITRSGKKTVQEFRNGPRGKERKRVVLHNLFQHLVEKRLLEHNPVKRIRIEVSKVSETPTLTRFEVHQMLEVAKSHPDPFLGLRNYVIIKLLAYTGIRIGELVGLNLDDIWRERDEMIVTRIDGEGDVILIPDVVRDDLYEYHDARKNIENVQAGHENAMFLSQQMRRIAPRSVRKMLIKVGNLAGVKTPITPQVFRKTYGKWEYERTGDMHEVAEQLGYSSVQTFKQTILEKE